MRKTFHSLQALMDYYQFIKFNVAACPTVLPKKDVIFGNSFNTEKAVLTREEKFAFIADIEKFTTHYTCNQPGYAPLPKDCVEEVFNFTLAQHVWLSIAFPNLKYIAAEIDRIDNQYLTYGQLAKRFLMKAKTVRQRTPERRIPTRLMHRQNLPKICRQIEGAAYKYFKTTKVITRKPGT